MTMQEKLRIHSEIEAANKAHWTPNLIPYDDKFEYQTAVSELRISLVKIKALADSFAHSFTEGTPEQNQLAVVAAPNTFVGLFAVLSDEVCRAVSLADRIDA